MQKTKKINLKKIYSLIKSAQKILITTHENPDGDGLGAIISLGMGLRQLGKKVVLYTKDPVPQMYRFLPGQSQIKHKLGLKEKYDLTLLVDLSELQRVSPVVEKHKGLGMTLCIDHHANASPNTDYSFCLPKQSSAGEIVYKILLGLSVQINKSMATNLYTAIATDTGSFKYSNTNKETFLIAAKLVELGVDVWDVALNCFETYSRARMELLKLCMKTMQIHPKGKMAWIVLKKKDFKQTKTRSEDAEGFINYPRSIEGVEIALLFKEKEAKKYKVSLRSKKYVDVAKIARLFEGGGHKRASGCTMEGSLEEVKSKIFKAILKKI